MDEAQTLRTEMEAAAAELNISPSTLGKMTGQGGHFYKRLQDGCRIWPETAASVRQAIEAIRSQRGRE